MPWILIKNEKNLLKNEKQKEREREREMTYMDSPKREKSYCMICIGLAATYKKHGNGLFVTLCGIFSGLISLDSREMEL